MTLKQTCNVVISQPMLFPWVGMFEQIRLADIFVVYDDVQFSKGSFVNRVQIPMPDNQIKWLTIPLQEARLGTQIRGLHVQPAQIWQPKQLEFLRHHYRKAPFAQEMLTLVRETYAEAESPLLLPYLQRGLLNVCRYLGLLEKTRFLNASELNIPGSSSQRVLDVVSAVGGSVYITGHGARNYLQHEAFAAAGVEVRYMHYQKSVYAQIHRQVFDPYVSILDLIANKGPESINYLVSQSTHWKTFLNS